MASSTSKNTSRCDLCGIDTPTIFSYINHQESPDHQLKKFLKSSSTACSPRNSTSSVKAEDLYDFDNGDIFKCRICDIFVTGIIPFKQHLSGIKHEKKLRNKEALKNFDISDLLQNLKLSDEKLNTQSDKPNSEEDEVGNELVIYNGRTQAEKKYDEKTSIGQSMNVAFPYICQPCGKRFTGEEPFNQHLSSVVHLKKIQTTANTTTILNNFSCNICCANFSGPIPYQQHVVSQKHAKQVHANKLFGFVPDEAEGSKITEYSTVDDERKEQQQREMAMWQKLALTTFASSNRKSEEVECIKADEPIKFWKR